MLIPDARPSNTQSSAEIWDSLTPNWREMAELAVEGLATKFSLPEVDFDLFKTESVDSYAALAVGYTALSGIDLGDPALSHDRVRSWHGMFADQHKRDWPNRNSQFYLTLKGFEYDCREATSRDVYLQMIHRAQISGIMPDSQSPDRYTSLTCWTWTALTGEGALRDSMPLASTLDKHLYMSGASLNSDTPGIRFRPGVMLY